MFLYLKNLRNKEIAGRRYLEESDIWEELLSEKGREI